MCTAIHCLCCDFTAWHTVFHSRISSVLFSAAEFRVRLAFFFFLFLYLVRILKYQPCLKTVALCNILSLQTDINMLHKSERGGEWEADQLCPFPWFFFSFKIGFYRRKAVCLTWGRIDTLVTYPGALRFYLVIDPAVERPGVFFFTVDAC